MKILTRIRHDLSFWLRPRARTPMTTAGAFWFLLVVHVLILVPFLILVWQKYHPKKVAAPACVMCFSWSQDGTNWDDVKIPLLNRVTNLNYRMGMEFPGRIVVVKQ